ncbi:MAG: 3-dehydroquinate synthase [Candidatus Krumholzibacteriia bacterium]
MNPRRKSETPGAARPGPPADARTCEAPVVIVTGFMGTGKTEVGRALAELLGLEFIDTDEALAASAGKSIADIFESEGEDRFREMEAAFCRSLGGRLGVVIATGGGTLMNPGTFELFTKLGTVVLLEASIDVLCERLADDRGRPLVAPDGSGTSLGERIGALLGERAGVYGRIPLKIDTSDGQAEEAAAAIAARLEMPRVTMTASFRAGPAASAPGRAGRPAAARRPGGDAGLSRGRFGACAVDIGRGLLCRLGERLTEIGLHSHAYFLIPEQLQDLYATRLNASMRAASIPFSIVPIRDGDAEKTLTQASTILDALIAAGARRDAVVIPVGGGVTGDIGGFVASVFMRGVSLVQVPTTLLAQVDASIGGKVGVNHPLAKNLIGCFYQPHLVVSDPGTLSTLPLEEVSNGMAEVVKSALVRSEAFFEYLESQVAHEAEERLRDPAFLEKCVLEAARIKVEVVNQDPFERGLRRMLNLGHTLGHALEASVGYRGFKHGQAVAVGIVAAVRIAAARGVVPSGLVDRTRSLLEWCGLPTTAGSVDRDQLAVTMRLDKKIKKGKLHFVLPVRVGEAKIVDDVSPEEILSTIDGG